MPFLIGTDEAGYGPNLGPLTVTGTQWQVDSPELDLFDTLSDVVSNQPARSRLSSQLFVADSKKVYSGSIHDLELGVLAMTYAATGHLPGDWRELTTRLCPPNSLDYLPDQPWLSGRQLSLPLQADPGRIKEFGDRIRICGESVGVQLVELQCVPVFPPHFNLQIERLGNKATLLSTETLRIVRRLLDQSDDDVEIGCDKHGGRSKYAALIQSILTDELVMIGDERLEASDYSFRENERDVLIRFKANGESFLPTAAASMVAKYVREIFMRLWNDFWQLQIPDIKPTKGYPVDARRFKSEIEAAQAKLGIADQTIWRNK